MRRGTHGIIAMLFAIGCGGSLPVSSEARQTEEPQDASVETTLPAEPSTRLSAAVEAQPEASRESAVIRGTVKLAGQAPKPQPIQMAADPVCQQAHGAPFPSQEVVVNEHGQLKNVFVYVKEGVTGTYPAPTNPVTLDQSGCWYTPRVLGLQTNQPLEIINSDPTLHNVNARPTQNPPFNVAQPSNKAPRVTKTFAKPEVMVKFKCNVHPWMAAFVGVVAHPFFSVSDGEGAFTISGLPAGTYTLEAWHEKYGTQTQSVTVGQGETKSVEFTFQAQ